MLFNNEQLSTKEQGIKDTELVNGVEPAVKEQVASGSDEAKSESFVKTDIGVLLQKRSDSGVESSIKTPLAKETPSPSNDTAAEISSPDTRLMSISMNDGERMVCEVTNIISVGFENKELACKQVADFAFQLIDKPEKAPLEKLEKSAMPLTYALSEPSDSSSKGEPSAVSTQLSGASAISEKIGLDHHTVN